MKNEHVYVSRILPSGVWGAQRIADEPEEWFTLAAGKTREDAIAKARVKWPTLPIVAETTCAACSGLGEDAEGYECDECDGECVVDEDIHDCGEDTCCCAGEFN